MLKRLILLLMVLVLCVTAVPLSASAEGTLLKGTVKDTTKLHLRDAPSTDGRVIRDFQKGATVEIIENNGTWCYVRKGEQCGYVMTKYLDITPNYEHLGWGKTEKKDAILTVFTKPDSNSPALCYFYSGACFELCEKSGEWYKVRIGDQFGYIRQDLVTQESGEFEIGILSPAVSSFSTDFSAYGYTVKEYGDEITIRGTEGNTAYTFTYPITEIGVIDAAISSWLKAQRKALPENAVGTLTVNYESFRADERYVSIALTCVYSENGLSCDNHFCFIIDGQTNTICRGADILSDTTRMNLILESKISKFVVRDTDGYCVTPDNSWFDNTVLTRDGLFVYLSAGEKLPVSISSQRIGITLREAGDCLAVDSELVRGFVIDPTKPMVAITFDDGPGEHTDRILDLLLQYGGHATFCVQGRWVGDHESTVKRMVAEGHEIANHTYSHKKLTTLSSSQIKSQLTRTNEAIQQIVPGYQVRWLRCPGGSNNKTVRNVCKGLDMCIAFWQIDTEDWSTLNAKSTYNNIMKNLKNGAIILCHDIYSTTADAMELVIPELIARGYQLVTLSEMFQYLDGGPVPGTTYTILNEEDNIALK